MHPKLSSRRWRKTWNLLGCSLSRKTSYAYSNSVSYPSTSMWQEVRTRNTVSQIFSAHYIKMNVRSIYDRVSRSDTVSVFVNTPDIQNTNIFRLRLTESWTSIQISSDVTLRTQTRTLGCNIRKRGIQVQFWNGSANGIDHKFEKSPGLQFKYPFIRNTTLCYRNSLPSSAVNHTKR